MNIIGIDIGGTKTAIVKSDKNNKILFHKKFSTTTADDTLDRIFSTIDNLLKNEKEQTLFGISCGGPLNSEKGIILSPPNLPGWNNIHIVKMLETKFNSKAYLMNDANACALAEWYFGAAKGYKNVIFLTHGTGNGAGLILNGQLYEGASGDAGEIGHIRMSPDGPIGYHKAGSFEGWTSGGGIAKIAQKYARERNGEVSFNPGKIELITAKDVAAAVEAGDIIAIKIFQESSYYLGMGLAFLVDILNPEIIVLGSIYTRCKDLMDPIIMDVLKNEALSHSLEKCKIVQSKLGEDIGNYGAISVAKYYVH